MVALSAAALMPKAVLAEIDAPDCAKRKDVLGVSRVVEVDPTHGLRFGRMQYKDFSFQRIVLFFLC